MTSLPSWRFALSRRRRNCFACSSTPNPGPTTEDDGAGWILIPHDITRRPLRGYLYIAAATFLWGVSATLGRAVFTGQLPLAGESAHPIEPIILSQCRTTFSFLILLAILLPRRGSKLRLPAADLGRTLLLGVFGVAASNYLYYLAIQKTNVATAITLQYTAPVWVLLYMVMRGREQLSWRRVGAVILAVCGIAVVIGVFSKGALRLDRIGVIASVLAAFSFAFYNVAGHDILERYDRWTVLLYTTFGAALFWIIVNPPWKVAVMHYSGAQWLFLLIFALVSVLGPFSLYFAGLQHLPPTRAIVTSCLEPVFSILIAAVVLGELMRPLQTLGIVMVLAAIIVVQASDAKPEQRNVVA
ncbi:MAG: EamA family transporter [Acidobacteriales bacterium]|nr:EamA family transporter [Terriglobales bacterium]